MTLILGGRAICPQCEGHRFACSRESDMDAKIACLDCAFVSTIKQALDSGFAHRCGLLRGISRVRPIPKLVVG
jgi:hypothetical protein